MWQNHSILYPQFHHRRHDEVRIARERSRIHHDVRNESRVHRHTQ